MINASAALIMGAILLLPSYFIGQSKLLENKSKATIAQSKNRNSIDTLLELPKELNSKLRIMRSSENTASKMETFREIIDAKNANVRINSINYAKAQKADNGDKNEITISGVALDRKSLIDFSQKLKENKKFSGVDVPVFSLTRERDLPFSISIFVE